MSCTDFLNIFGESRDSDYNGVTNSCKMRNSPGFKCACQFSSAARHLVCVLAFWVQARPQVGRPRAVRVMSMFRSATHLKRDLDPAHECGLRAHEEHLVTYSWPGRCCRRGSRRGGVRRGRGGRDDEGFDEGAGQEPPRPPAAPEAPSDPLRSMMRNVVYTEALQ